MNIPKVEFIYAFPLDADRRALFAEKGLGEYPSIAEVTDRIALWKELWDKVNQDDRVITKLIELTGGVPSRSLECFVLGAGFRPMSTPFLVPMIGREGTLRTDEEFIETFIHELSHIFISRTPRYWKMVREKYAQESMLTQNHILVYALLKKVYLDLFGKEPGDLSRSTLPPDYERAISMIGQIGHDELIREFQDLR